jgi:altronate dehydratase small subunit
MRIVNAIHVSSLDNCVTLAGAAVAGDTVRFVTGDGDGGEKTVTVRGCIPIWHKMAVMPVTKGSGVYKYGAVIGVALEDIAAGDHVHVHNICSPAPGG